MSKKEQFTTFGITKGLGIEYGRLREWIDGQFIIPSIQKATKQGTKNLFSLWDVYMIEYFIQLLAKGFSRKQAGLRVGAFVNLVRMMKGRKKKFDPGKYEYVAIVCKKDDIQYNRFITENEIKHKTIPELITVHTYDFDDIVLINFRKIKEKVDRALL